MKNFSAMVYCPKKSTVQLYQFLHTLVSAQSPRTINQATVNTLQQSVSIDERDNRKFINQFYWALDKIFQFQLGRILLATASPFQLQDMVRKDWPFFTHISKNNMDLCLHSGVSCPEVDNIGILLNGFTLT